MKNKKNIIILVIAIIIFCIALTVAIWGIYSKNTQNNKDNIVVEEVSKTKDIEDVEYTDFIFYKEDRSEVKLSDYKDKAAMILFWNSEVEDSIKMLERINEMYEKYSDKINFFMINTTEKVDDKIKSSVSMEIYYDLYKEGVLKYNVSELPSMIYISEDNKIMNAKSGLTTIDALEANLDILSNNF